MASSDPTNREAERTLELLTGLASELARGRLNADVRRRILEASPGPGLAGLQEALVSLHDGLRKLKDDVSTRALQVVDATVPADPLREPRSPSETDGALAAVTGRPGLSPPGDLPVWRSGGSSAARTASGHFDRVHADLRAALGTCRATEMLFGVCRRAGIVPMGIDPAGYQRLVVHLTAESWFEEALGPERARELRASWLASDEGR
ncbi:MAG: hypothetical protein HY814_10270 [Candidatus Riflebacteria bacterium]|nr:hypothetical protein [Candidatus Riflebacteria bacterium]